MIPHNPDEVMNAVIKRMQGKLNTVDQLIRVMPGPDFPTYGQIFGVDGIKEYYETGKGSFLVRSKYELILSLEENMKSCLLSSLIKFQSKNQRRNC